MMASGRKSESKGEGLLFDADADDDDACFASDFFRSLSTLKVRHKNVNHVTDFLESWLTRELRGQNSVRGDGRSRKL